LDSFVVTAGLALNERESIYLVTGYAEQSDCVGTLKLTSCTLESATGEYDVDIRGNVAYLENAGNPTIIALANNTAVDHTWAAGHDGHPATLASVVGVASQRWEGFAMQYDEPGVAGLSHFTIGTAWSRFEYNSELECPSYRDPRPDVMQSLNSLMVRSAALAAAENASYAAFLESRMDEGLSFESSTTGYM